MLHLYTLRLLSNDRRKLLHIRRCMHWVRQKLWRQLNEKTLHSTRKRKLNNIMKVLNVAEKNDAAKNIAGYLSRGALKRRDGFSVYNKIYEFKVQLWGQNCQMIMTSVSGHLLNLKFTGAYSSWQSCHPLSLFEAPIVKDCVDETFVKIRRTLENEVRGCNALIIWTDCDREGENIGFEIIQVCQAIKSNISIHRAKFSEITQVSIDRALRTLEAPNKLVSDAVDVRIELDLRIGAAFTRFQTLRLQKVFPSSLADMLISYGSCQFPTLGFVVERFLAIERFKPEPYWKIKVTDIRGEIQVDFRWHRVRLFEELPCQVFLDICLERPDARVEKVTRKPKSKWRPLPLDTIELEKQASRKLRLNAKHTMKIAEKLYTQGLISYPRTETNIFPKELNLLPIVTQQTNSSAWGNFAERLLNDGLTPRQGKKSDQAHPPIHPTKYADNLHGDEGKVYEYIVRHFLACLAKNAEGEETVVDIEIAGEKFTATGLQINRKNYLEVYIYEKWSNKEIYAYQQGQVFKPTFIEMVNEETSAPNLLTEADLIALMDKHGIGTDATHAEHIDTIKSRQYVGLVDEKYFIPGKLGIGLVTGYDDMGYAMSKPNLRADLEKDLKLICDGVRRSNDVLQEQIKKYRDMFKITLERANLIDAALARYLDEQPLQTNTVQLNFQSDTAIFKCPKCRSNMVLRDRKNSAGKFISCMGYPKCNNVVWLPQTVENVSVLQNSCNQCPGNMRKMEFKLKRNAFPIYGTNYTACIGGCDPEFNETLGIRQECVRRTRSNDSGYATASSTNIQSGTMNSVTASNRGGDYSTSRHPTTERDTGRNRQRESNTRTVSGRSTAVATSAAPRVSRNPSSQTSDWGHIDDDAVIVCNCGDPANRLTVRKDGPNQGRLFFKCNKPQGSGCDFFLWASDGVTPREDTHQGRQVNSSINDDASNGNVRSDWNASRAMMPPTNHSSPFDVVKCRCNVPAKRLAVRKDGPNKGREFYGCVKGPADGCNFFQWADDTPNTGGASQYGGDRHNTERGRRRDNASTSTRTTSGGKRKCGVCGVEGHTRRTCPENVMD